ncbi:MAG: hypothetical protein K9K64_02200 [Desulfohalobiaceae bacterium]|nr:hypothetical protein [Desulfohalobiaceae bacterium]
MIKGNSRPGQNGRLLALKVAFKTQGARDLQAGLNQEISRTRGLADREKRLATELVYGYARFKGRIDWIASCFLKKGTKRLPVHFLTILGQGIYELLFLDRVPDYAAVDFYVRQAGERWGGNLSGLANAVLRRVVRERSALKDKEFYRVDRPDLETFYSRYYSCPGWMIRILIRSLGPEAVETVLKQSIRPPLVGVRINRQAPGCHELAERLARLPEAALSRPPGLAFWKTPAAVYSLEEKGRLSRQSLASQQALACLAPQSWPQPVWDCCAGHGGKTGQLLEIGLKPVWASDRVSWKAALCRQELSRLSFSNVPVFSADAARAHPLKQRPGTILLDAPCSGLGVLNRRPDIKWKLNQEAIPRLLEIQSQMLSLACDTIQRQGLVVYLTCTLNRDENQEQIAKTLDGSVDRISLEKEYSTPIDSPLGEYFYAAVLRKK